MKKEIYKLCSVFFIGILITFFLSYFSLLEIIAEYLIKIDPFGPIVAGVLFVFTITISSGGSLLSMLAQIYPIEQVALLGGIGGVLGDYLFFNIIRGIKKHILKKPRREKIVSVPHIFENIEHSPLGRLLMPLLGAIIIASPFPDEIGIFLLGASGINKKYFLVISYVMNVVGIYAFVQMVSAIN